MRLKSEIKISYEEKEYYLQKRISRKNKLYIFIFTGKN